MDAKREETKQMLLGLMPSLSDKDINWDVDEEALTKQLQEMNPAHPLSYEEQLYMSFFDF